VTVGRAPVRGRSGLRIGARRSGGEVVGGGDAEAPFYRVRGGAGRQGCGGGAL
jgi:formylmethanofuran dehydrogenase subunit C